MCSVISASFLWRNPITSSYSCGNHARDEFMHRELCDALFLGGLSVTDALVRCLVEPRRISIGRIHLRPLFGSAGADTCRLSVPFTTNVRNVRENADELVVASPWLAMMSFFIGYLLSNALALYNREPIANAINVSKDPLPADASTESGSSRRRMQSVISIFCIIVFAVYVLWSRLRGGCEGWLGAMITLSLFAYGGHGWFKLLSTIGQDRLSDLFGIANRLLSPGAIMNQPIACVEVPA